MKLIVEVFTGHWFYVEVEEDATVADLKARVQENFPRHRLILMLDTGKERTVLDNDEARLGDSGIQDSSRIYIFFGAKTLNNEDGYGGDSSSHHAHSTPLSPKEAHSYPKEAPPSPKKALLSPKEVVSCNSHEDALNERPGHDEKPSSASADPNSDRMEG